VPPTFFVVVSPRDDVTGSGTDLLVASGAPVRLHGFDRLHRAHLPSGWRAHHDVSREGRPFLVVGLAASPWMRAPRRHANAPPSMTIEDPVT
jgi:hypothetical protein